MLCPLCRVELPGSVYFHEHSHNKVVLALRQLNHVITLTCI